MAKATKTAAAPITLTFSLERETKGTFRFAEDGDEPKVGTLYVKKSVFGSKAPDALTVTIEAK